MISQMMFSQMESLALKEQDEDSEKEEEEEISI